MQLRSQNFKAFLFLDLEISRLLGIPTGLGINWQSERESMQNVIFYYLCSRPIPGEYLITLCAISHEIQKENGPV